MKKTLKLLLIFAVAFTTAATAQTGKIVFENAHHNFGNNVPEKGGNVTHRFVFTNKGDVPVTIQNVTASCGCTTPAWTKEPVAPGAQGFVDATYRPLGRVGGFSKNLTVTSNGNPARISLTISGTVVREPLTIEEEFANVTGGLRTNTTTFAYGRINKNGEVRTTQINVYNNSDAPIAISFKGVPKYLNVTAEPATLEPKARGVVKCVYTVNENPEYGTRIDNFEMLQNGKKVENGNLSANATLMPHIVYDKNAANPAIQWINTNYNFENVKKGGSVTHEFKFKNTGKANIEIAAATASNENIKVVTPKAPVAPGEEGAIKVTMNTKKIKAGNHTFTIEVISNVPTNPLANIILRGTIVE